MCSKVGMLRESCIVVAVVLSTLTGCAAAPDPGESSSEAASDLLGAASPSRAKVEAAIATLDAHRESEPLAPYYADGSRLEGCWRNPAGKKLSDLQKAFYCAMPLELRLCNTVKLLAIDEAKVEERYEAYLGCQKKVDAVFGGTGAFVYDGDVNAVYRQLFLERASMSEEDTDRIVAANRPTMSDRAFPFVLLAIGTTLTKEAADLALARLTSLADDYRDETRSEPR